MHRTNFVVAVVTLTHVLSPNVAESKRSQTIASDGNVSVSSALAPDIKPQRVDFDLFQTHSLDSSYTFDYQANRKASRIHKTYNNVLSTPMDGLVDLGNCFNPVHPYLRSDKSLDYANHAYFQEI